MSASARDRARIAASPAPPAGGPVARGSLWMLGANAAAAVAQTGATALLARWLPAEAFGALALLALVAQIAGAAAQLGLGSALIQARAVERAEARAVLGLAWLQGLALWAAVACAAPLLGALLGSPGLARLLPVYAVTLLFGPPSGVALALLQRRLAFGRVAALQLLGLAVGIATSLAAALAGPGARHDAWALVAGRLAADATILVAALGSLGSLARPSLALARARRFVAFGASVAGTQLLNTIASQLDTALLGVSLGAAALGHYSIASSLVMLPASRLAGVVKGVAFAALAREARADGASPTDRAGPGFERAALLLLSHVCVTCAAPVVGLALVAPDLVRVALGAGWQDTTALLVALAPAGVVYAWGSAMGAILLARGAARIELRFALLRLLVLGPLLAAGAALAGARGAALAVSTYAILCLPLFFGVLARWGGLAPGRVARALAPGLVAAVAMAPPVLAAHALCATSSPLLRLVAEIGAGGGAFIGCLRALFPDDFAALAATARRALPAVGRVGTHPPAGAAEVGT